MRQVNVDKMSLKDLLALELRVKKAIIIARDRERTELKRNIESMVSESGFTVAELFAGGRGGPKGRIIAPKYANPDDPSETWTGRGRKPKWLTARIGKGGKLDDFLI